MPALDRCAEAGAFPRVVLIDSVSYCNLRCSMCFHRAMTRRRGFMPWPLFTKIVDEIAREAPEIRVWMVFFGEALIRKRQAPTIFDMITYAKKAGLKDVVLNSNAQLLDTDSAERLIDAGLDAIYVGIDALSPETYRNLRVGGDYARVVGNVRGLIEVKRRRGAVRPAVFVQFVEMPENVEERDAFVAFWTREGATVKVRPKVSWAGMIDAPNLVLGDEQRWPCHWAMQTMSITDSGQVVTCAVDLDARFVAGDVNRQSLADIWNGPLKQLRSLHLGRHFAELPEHCARCRDWQSARAEYHSREPL